jgi:F0F1-type ATP synthase membrane subunit c/vacuolar-type H+-ATPase subunit K
LSHVYGNPLYPISVGVAMGVTGTFTAIVGEVAATSVVEVTVKEPK